MNMFKRFLREDEGQDLIEYTLLLAFVALVSAAIFIAAGNEAKGIWAVANNHLKNANTAAS